MPDPITIWAMTVLVVILIIGIATIIIGIIIASLLTDIRHKLDGEANTTAPLEPAEQAM